LPVPDKPIYIQNSNLTKKALSEALKYNLFNNSSLCFRKDFSLKYENFMNKIKIALDTFLGWLFLSMHNIMIWNSPLSIYRIHQSNTTLNVSSLENYIKLEKEKSLILYDDYKVISDVCHGTKLENMIKALITFHELGTNFIYESKVFDIKFIDVIHSTILFDKKSFLVFFLSKMPYSLRKIIMKIL